MLKTKLTYYPYSLNTLYFSFTIFLLKYPSIYKLIKLKCKHLNLSLVFTALTPNPLRYFLFIIIIFISLLFDRLTINVWLILTNPAFYS